MLFALGVVMALTIFQSVAYYQLANVFQVWLDVHVALRTESFHIPAAWFQSIDSFFSILSVPVLFALWAWTARRRSDGQEPDDLWKIGIGACVCAMSNLLLVAAVAAAGDALVHPVWPFLYCADQGIGFIYYWPTLLAWVSRSAPAQVNATAMGFAFMTLFVSNNMIGWIGGFYEKMTPLQFWAMQAGIALTGAALTFLLRSTLRCMLAARPADQPLRASALTLEVER